MSSFNNKKYITNEENWKRFSKAWKKTNERHDNRIVPKCKYCGSNNIIYGTCYDCYFN